MKPAALYAGLLMLFISVANNIQRVEGSYLTPPHFHFAGTFFSDPGTLNNFINNYNPKNPIIPWWGPDGLGYFRFKQVNVTASEGMDGVDATDCVIGASVSTNYGGKIVDLDPDQQFISQLYGVKVTVSLPSGFHLTGSLEVMELDGLWWRVRDGTMDTSGMSGKWQTVMSNISWSGQPPSCSPTLTQLWRNSNNALSIRLVVDTYDNNNNSATFNVGRLVGTIGAYVPGEPQQFVASRLVQPANANYSKAQFTVSNNQIYLDLANSIGVKTLGGDSVRDSLSVGVLVQDKLMLLKNGIIDTSRKTYLSTTTLCGIPLLNSEAPFVQSNPLAIVDTSTPNAPVVVLKEDKEGRYGYFDTRALRMENKDTEIVEIWVTQFGNPLAGQNISFEFVPSPMRPRPDRVNNIPAAGLTYPSTITTDAKGHAFLKITANLLGDRLPPARQYIDSQVYFIQAKNDSVPTGMLSVLVFNEDLPITNPTWTDVFPFFDLYARLFPSMAQMLDIGDKDTVDQNADSILAVMTLPKEDPNFMPVTRDLSQSRTQAMLAYLKEQIKFKQLVQGERQAYQQHKYNKFK